MQKLVMFIIQKSRYRRVNDTKFYIVTDNSLTPELIFNANNGSQ